MAVVFGWIFGGGLGWGIFLWGVCWLFLCGFFVLGFLFEELLGFVLGFFNLVLRVFGVGLWRYLLFWVCYLFCF